MIVHLLTGDRYIKMEFNLIMIAMVTIAVHHKPRLYRTLHHDHNGIIPIAMHLLSIVLLLYGRIQQQEVLSKNIWLREYDQLQDHQPIVSITEQQQTNTYEFLQFTMITWLASWLFDIRISQFIHKDIVEIVHNIGHNPSVYKLVVANALTVVILSSTMEITFICSISGDWTLFIYMLSSISSRILRTIIQGKQTIAYL